jgi:hypothetical protein
VTRSDHHAGVPVPPEYPEPTIPLPEPHPEREPFEEPWQDPDTPFRKVNVPPERPQPGPPIENPERLPASPVSEPN